MVWTSHAYDFAGSSDRFTLGCPVDLRGYVDPSPTPCTLIPNFPFTLPNSAALVDDTFVKVSVGFGHIVFLVLNVLCAAIAFRKKIREQPLPPDATWWMTVSREFLFDVISITSCSLRPDKTLSLPRLRANTSRLRSRRHSFSF